MTVSRGEIYYAGLPNDPKKRPAVVLTANWLSRHSLAVAVVPITSVERRAFPTRVAFERGEVGLKVRSWGKCDQVTTIPKTLLSEHPVGRLGLERMREIEQAVRLALDFA